MATLPSLRTTLLAAVGALALILPLVAAPPALSSQHEEEGVTPARAGGEDRYETAQIIATLTFETAGTAHVVTGERFPDALAASFGAGAVDGPVLLTLPDTVPQATWDALEALETHTVVVVGGTDAISASVEQELSDQGYTTHRVEGDDRYETAAEVAVRYAEAVGTLEADRTALLATGENFPDALAGGPVAAGAGFPLLLTPGHTTHEAVDDALESLEIDRILVLGGPDAVSSEVVTYYQDRGYTVERFGGDTRQGTAMLMADFARARLGWTADLVLLARGDDFPDALVASIHGARLTAPILLTVSPGSLGDGTRFYLDAICPEVEAIRALGGTDAIATPVLADAVEAAEGCFDEPQGAEQSYIIGPQEPITANVGTEVEFHLIGTYDDGPMQVGELALFPCESVTLDQGRATFADTNDDGFADGSGETDTDSAWISQINDVAQGETQRRDRGMDHEEYNFHVTSNAPDCTVPVMWDAGPHETELPVDADGEPTVRFGVGQVEFVAG